MEYLLDEWALQQLIKLLSPFIIFIIAIVIIVKILQSPFKYPYFVHVFDVSGKRNPKIENLLDDFLINDGFEKILNYRKIIENWKDKSKNKLNKSLLKKLRTKQYEKCLDDEHAFQFLLMRKQTRYHQKNYQKTAYKVMQTIGEYHYSYEQIEERDKKLREINYECTLNKYHSKNQRKLVTQNLRKEIMERDNYTCQKCGKYMPDEVGLHIDHIIPVSKGGKSIPSNLQVLCSKCNGKKSNKV